jgi:hypothetical protein
MVQQIESQNKPDKVSASYFHHETYIICPQVTINNIQIPVQTQVKYLVLYDGREMTWQKHVKTYNLYAGSHQQDANTGSNRNKILGLIRRPGNDMAETRQNNVSEIKLKTTRHFLTFGL